jgi:hypothetical protein
MCGAVGPRGRRRRRQGTRCEGYCEATLSAPVTALCPRLGTAIHMRRRRRLRVRVRATGLPMGTIFRLRYSSYGKLGTPPFFPGEALAAADQRAIRATGSARVCSIFSAYPKAGKDD